MFLATFWPVPSILPCPRATCDSRTGRTRLGQMEQEGGGGKDGRVGRGSSADRRNGQGLLSGKGTRQSVSAFRGPCGPASRTCRARCRCCGLQDASEAPDPGRWCVCALLKVPMGDDCAVSPGMSVVCCRCWASPAVSRRCGYRQDGPRYHLHTGRRWPPAAQG